MTPPNTYVAKAQPRCPPRPQSPKKTVPTSCNARGIRYSAWAWSQIYIRKRYLNLTFLSVTDTYVYCENRSLIQSLALMRLVNIFYME